MGVIDAYLRYIIIWSYDDDRFLILSRVESQNSSRTEELGIAFPWHTVE